MPHPMEYAVKGALMMCDKGAAPGQFSPTINPNVKVSSALVSTELDVMPIVHIPCFGACAAKGGSPCTPTPIRWMDTWPVKVKGGETLLFKSYLPCGSGGKIEFLTSGQVPLPPGALEELMEEHGEEEEEGGWGWWDTAELIPVVGNVIGMVREAKKGNWGMFALNAAFLVVDVVTFGAGAAVTTPLKGGIKAGVKVAAKTAAKAATKQGAKQLAKGAAKAFGKAVAKQVDDIAKAIGKVCVFACFPAGTKIAVENGHKPIEDITAGDFVYAREEDSGKIARKRVLQISSRTVDATVAVRVAEETVTTTPDHPFFTRSGWKVAGQLTVADELVTRSGDWHRVQEVTYGFEATEVYNFEVEDWHNYFVGAWEWLVHNSNPCVSNAVKRLGQIATKPFKRNPKHSAAEFAQQIADQQKGLNNLTVDDFLKNRNAYLRNGRSSAGSNAQSAFRQRAHADKVKELRAQGLSRRQANQQADAYMKKRAALHDPDQIAGGFGHNVTRMGDKGVNSSLGSQWKSRIGDVDSQVRQQAQNMTDAQKKSTFLDIKLPWQ